MTDEEGSAFSVTQQRRARVITWIALGATVVIVGGGSALVFWLGG